WRGELESPGVQEEPIEAIRPAPRRARAVDRIAGDRMTDRVEMDPDLVRPAGDQVELEERPGAEPLANAVTRDRGAAIGDHRHAGPMPRVATDRRFDPSHRGT